MNSTLSLAKELIAESSISPDQSACQRIIADVLTRAGFSVRNLPFHGAHNLWATIGKDSPPIVFSGHTDVVPPGELTSWDHQPFSPHVKDEKLYGRGAADMKGAVAAMVTAATEFAEHNPTLPCSIGLLITGDEEIGGASVQSCLDLLYSEGTTIHQCIVGEPSSNQSFGDTIKIGRRGSLDATVKLLGKLGHVGYPHLAENAIHAALLPLSEVVSLSWQDGGKFFEPTTAQITSITGGVASNVIPAECLIKLNFRFSYYTSPEEIARKVEQALSRYKVSFEISWSLQARPFLTSPGRLVETVQETLQAMTGQRAVLATGGGTSDARYFAAKSVEVLEVGGINSSIHQANEWIALEELEKLRHLYLGILQACAVK